MAGRSILSAGILLISAMICMDVAGQISPGELSEPHSHLTGLSNCTKCHVMGNKIQDEKCLSCHNEINKRIAIQKGYHSSAEVKGKKCIECHSEHNGRNFQLIRLDLNTFDHNLTGYPLSAPHAKQDCRTCHTAENITDPDLKSRKKTYLGVNTGCLTCHEDYHIRTLSPVCSNCHNQNSFVPATEFSHDNAGFKLAGKHKSVDCSGCHRIQITDEKKFQQFSGIQYSNCASCHKDPHNNQFGQNCRQCHSEESFSVISGMKDFNHNNTGFPLEGKHSIVDCRACHKNRFTEPLNHGRCTDCHADYHNGQFTRNNKIPDCSECHTVKGFAAFSFPIEKHNAGPFPLNGAHKAVPCYECHRKNEKWSFREIGINCRDCHTDIHHPYLPDVYYPDANCKSCHTESKWTDISFDHSKTPFILTGSHITQGCRTCHFKADATGATVQKFTGLPQDCAACHKDNHFNQFDKDGKTTCTECHDTKSWDPSKFDHNKTAFRLDGGHEKVLCQKCHKSADDGKRSFVQYKLKETRCESCHY